jgi:hypothetical protein
MTKLQKNNSGYNSQKHPENQLVRKILYAKKTALRAVFFRWVDDDYCFTRRMICCL